MQEDKRVSLWVGHCNSPDIFDVYLETGYSEDGDFITSPFGRDFGIKRYEEDFREAKFFKKPVMSVRELLKGCSYDNIIIPKYIQLLGKSLAEKVNVMILLYNFRHDTGTEMNTEGDVTLRYMGFVTLD